MNTWRRLYSFLEIISTIFQGAHNYEQKKRPSEKCLDFLNIRKWFKILPLIVSLCTFEWFLAFVCVHETSEKFIYQSIFKFNKNRLFLGCARFQVWNLSVFVWRATNFPWISVNHRNDADACEWRYLHHTLFGVECICFIRIENRIE